MLLLTLAPLLVLVAGGGAYLWWTNRPDTAAAAQRPTDCPAPLQVLVAEELQPVVESVLAAADRAAPTGAANTAATDPATPRAGCRTALVRSTASAQTTLQSIGAGRVPEVWVPDSSTWLDDLPGGGDAPTSPDGWAEGLSVATSPVVLVSPTVGSRTVDTAPASWSEPINVTAKVRLANPDTDTAGRLAYFASRVSRPEALDLAVASKLIVASRFAAASTQSQFDALAKNYDALPFPASEQAAFAHAAAAPGTVRAFVPRAGTISLDYPWLVNRALPADRQVLADRAARALRSDAARRALAKAGFRTTDTAVRPRIQGKTMPPYTELPAPTAAQRAGALDQWHVLRKDMRMLAILDVSGSMRYPAKDTKGKSRAKVTEEAAVTALRILPAGSRIGAWVFSTDQNGKGVDYRELARVEQLDTPFAGKAWRDHLVAVTRTLPKRLGGDTGLYDTTAAAYQKMVAEYDPTHVNSVVIMTDGTNDDPGGGLDLPQLLARIRATSRADRPVRIITIGMGEADPTALKAISRATGGTSYTANTPADIQRVFVQALLARTEK
ncbi:MAG: substrate-binding domain-containing protein [Ornithinibacter sp.]